MKESRFIRSFLSAVLCGFLFHFNGFGQNKYLIINDRSSSKPIGKYVSLFEDRNMVYNDSEIIGSAQFVNERNEIPVKNKITSGNIWIRFSVINQTRDSALFLDLDYPNISAINVYKQSGNRLLKMASTGNNIAYQYKENTKPGFAFNLNLRANDTGTFFLKIKSFHPLLLPMFIMHPRELDEKISSENLIFGLYFGIMLSLLLYTCFCLLPQEI